MRDCRIEFSDRRPKPCRPPSIANSPGLSASRDIMHRNRRAVMARIFLYAVLVSLSSMLGATSTLAVIPAGLPAHNNAVMLPAHFSIRYHCHPAYRVNGKVIPRACHGLSTRNPLPGVEPGREKLRSYNPWDGKPPHPPQTGVLR